MNIEGIPPSITPQFLQALATGLLMLVAAIGLLELMGSLWRRLIWARSGDGITRVAAQLGAEPVGRWSGWSVVAAHVRVDWLGGLMGLRTRVTTATGRVEHPGLLGASAVLELIGA